MLKDRFIYYLAFPIVVLGLCGYSYFLGYSKGRQKNSPSITLVQPTKIKEDPVSSTLPDNLTFFKELRPKEIQDTKKQERWIQINAYQEIGKAHEFLDRLKNQGFRGRVNLAQGPKSWNKVVVGPYYTTRDLDEGLHRLVDKGFGKGFILEP